MGNYRPRLVAMLAAAMLAGATAVPVLAIPASSDQSADQEVTGRLQLVMDASGSMAEPTGDGTTRIEAAKSALNTVIDDLPDAADVGLRVFGAEVFSASDPGACEDSQQVVEPGTGNRDQLRAGVKDYEPYGETPIGYALQQAAEDLGGESQRTIVLVSDGEPTCDPDPCTVAADLISRGYNMQIHVVGLNVDGKTRKIMQCIADKGSGVYYDASNADELSDALTKLSTRAFKPFELTGQRIQGGATPSEATPIEPGQYIDTFPGQSRTPVDSLRPQYYRVSRTMPGSSIHAGVTALLRPGAGLPNGRIRILSAKNELCGMEYLQEGAGRGLFALGTTSEQKNTDDGCAAEDSVIIEVGYGAITAEGLAGADFELVVYEEPPTTSTDGLPKPEMATWTEMSAGQPRDDVEPGSSFSSAPVVDPGTYQMSMLPGETQIVAVNLDWGQHVQALMEVGPNNDVNTIGPPQFAIRAFGPYRTRRDQNSKTEGMPNWSMESGDMSARLGVATPPVRYLNRTADFRLSVNDAVVPGPYYIAVTDNSDPDEHDALIDYTLTVDVVGEAGEGAPAYEGEGSGGKAGSETPDEPETTDEPENTDPPADDDADTGATTPPGDEAINDDITNTASEDDDGMAISPGGIILAALGGGLLVGGGYLIRQAFKRNAA